MIWVTEKKEKKKETTIMQAGCVAHSLVLCPFPVFRLLAPGASYTDQNY